MTNKEERGKRKEGKDANGNGIQGKIKGNKIIITMATKGLAFIIMFRMTAHQATMPFSIQPILIDPNKMHNSINDSNMCHSSLVL